MGAGPQAFMTVGQSFRKGRRCQPISANRRAAAGRRQPMAARLGRHVRATSGLMRHKDWVWMRGSGDINYRVMIGLRLSATTIQYTEGFRMGRFG